MPSHSYFLYVNFLCNQDAVPTPMYVVESCDEHSNHFCIASKVKAALSDIFKQHTFVVVDTLALSKCVYAFIYVYIVTINPVSHLGCKGNICTAAVVVAMYLGQASTSLFRLVLNLVFLLDWLLYQAFT